MTTYTQVSNLDAELNLPQEDFEKFVEITDGDESLVRAFGPQITKEHLAEEIKAQGEDYTVSVVVSKNDAAMFEFFKALGPDEEKKSYWGDKLFEFSGK